MISDRSNSSYEAIRQVVFYPSDCLHPEAELRNKPDSKGEPRYHLQCLTCGASTAGRVSKANVDASLSIPLWDEDMVKVVWAKFRNDWEEERDRVRLKLDEDWQAQYREYLESPEWTAIRKIVLKRDGGVCKGCESRPATQVHHLTYEHVGREFLFELISICDTCHSRIHSK